MSKQKFVLKSVGIFFLGICLLFGPCGYSFSQEEFRYDAEKQRNPFMPLVTSDGRLLTLQQVPVVKQLILQGITFDAAGFSFCVINGEVVMVGDRIDDYQVIKIEADKVTLSKEGETLEMELRKEEEE